MSHQEPDAHAPDLTVNDALEPLSAFVDGEVVDPETLARALSHPEAQAFLLDAVRLRAAFEKDSRVPSDRLGERLRPRLEHPAPWWRRGVEVPLPLAAVMTLMLTAVLWFGWLGRPASAPVSDLTTGETSAVEAPAPTRTLQFEPGVDWNGS